VPLQKNSQQSKLFQFVKGVGKRELDIRSIGFIQGCIQLVTLKGGWDFPVEMFGSQVS